MVTGATGAVGRHVAHRLGTRSTLRVVVRDPQKAAHLGLPGEVVHGDYRDRQRMRQAVEGADALFLVTADPLRPEEDEHLLSAARAGGVRHVVKLSGLSVADPQASDLITQWNRRSEERLRSSGTDWTVLRIRALMSNTLSWAESACREGVVRGLGPDRYSACVDPRDVADAAVTVLTQGSGHAGRVYSLTGPAAITPRQQAAGLSRVLGRPVAFEELSAQEALTRWRRRYPEPVAAALLEGAQQPEAVKCRVEKDLSVLTGRPARTYAHWLDDHGDWFRCPARGG